MPGPASMSFVPVFMFAAKFTRVQEILPVLTFSHIVNPTNAILNVT